MADPAPESKSFFRSFIDRGLHWPLGLICMFLVSASFVLVTAVFGAGKGSRAIEPDYYARSLEWDSEKDQLKAAARLGWDVQVSASPTLDPTGSRLVSVMIVDADQSPIEGSLIELVCFSQANAHLPLSKVLPEAGAGQYQTRIESMHTKGLWEFRISIRHAGEQALLIKSIELEG